MKFSQYWSTRKTPQMQAIPGAGMIPNSAGGYAFALDPWARLDRFLILGTEGGTYYIKERKLTEDSARNALALIRQDGPRVVARIVEISHGGRAPKNDPAIFLLAMAAAQGDPATRSAAFEALPKVCRTGTHLFQFASEVNALRGWGRGLRRAVADWYNQSEPEALTLQAIKYQQRQGWSHRDLLRLAHPRPASEAHRVLYKWIVDGVQTGENLQLEGYLRLRGTQDAQAAARLIRDHALPRECVPTELLKEAIVWEALLDRMPYTALVRNLATMTRIGLIEPGSEATRTVVQRLGNGDALRKARVHPLALLLAHATYASGRGFRGDGQWSPVPKVIDALDSAFYAAFQNVEPTGLRYLLGVDVSGSMGGCTVAGSPLSACEAATAMAMLTVATEDSVRPMAFCHEFVPLPISAKMRLKDALRLTRDRNYGATDCAVPMIEATRHRWKVDVFVVYTDSETWFGQIHPLQALREYRDKMGIPAKLIVVGMASNGFTIADPGDGGMLDVVGFDAAVPEVMRAFLQ